MGFEKEGEFEREPLPDFIRESLEDEHNPKLAELWSSSALESLDINGYVELLKSHASGHLVTHAISVRFERFYPALSEGLLIPSRVFEEVRDRKGLNVKTNPSRRSMVPSSALHFSVDEFYTRNSEIGLIASVEALLENKGFLSIPLEYVGSAGTDNDMTVSGIVEDPTDKSNLFHIDELGILLIPESARVYADSGEFVGKHENWNEELTPTMSIQDYIEKLRQEGKSVPRRVYFYKGRSAQEGLAQFLGEHNLKVPPTNKKVTTSGPVVPLYKRERGQFKHFDPEGRGAYYGVAH